MTKGTRIRARILLAIALSFSVYLLIFEKPYEPANKQKAYQEWRTEQVNIIAEGVKLGLRKSI